MERKKLKVGTEYGVVLRTGQGARDHAVAATVVDLDATFVKPPSWGNGPGLSYKGGIRIRFTEPTRVAHDFNLAARTNEHAGPIVEEYVYDPKMGARGILAPWAELVAERKARAEHKLEQDARLRVQAAEFAPVLAAYLEKLRAAGFKKVGVYGDGSGIRAEGLAVGLNAAYIDGKRVPIGFKTFDSVSLNFSDFGRLLVEASS